MVGVAAVDNSTATFSETELLAGYNKLISIRDEIIGKKIPATEQINHSADLTNARAITQPASAAGRPAKQVPDGTSKPAAASSIPPAPPSILNVSKNHANAFLPKSPRTPNLSTQTPGSSGIDPIFLTKSSVLVKAEINQKRQRLEKALEDQIYKSQKQKVFEQDALPDFDVTDVLKQAQELVKPIKVLESRRANGVASSSDSFDERTFYSSQMDDSTTTEETDESHKWRPRRICKFYLQGTHCRYGDSCTFSHDPSLKQKLETEASQGMEIDKFNADEQASSHHNAVPNKRPPKADMHPQRTEKATLAEHPTSQNQAERERRERIARLEAELRSAKAEQETVSSSQLHHQDNEKNGYHEESVYSPPEPDEFGRDIGLRETGRQQTTNVPSGRLSADVRPSAREYTRPDRNSPSSAQTNVRVVTNHIRSPVAPQPSRVSPLATAKLPQVSQIQRETGDNRRSSRGSNAGNSSGRQSPKIAPQPRSSKKRRRGRDSGEQTRSVIPRTDYASPVIRIKEEPVSPPPFDMANTGMRQTRLRQEPPRPLYVNTAATPYEQSLVYQTRSGDLSAPGQFNDDREPRTPFVRRIVSRNGQRFITNEEPELRRVVTAPRPARAPVSPAPYSAQYSAPQPRAARAASQVYLSPTGQAVSYQNQPPTNSHGSNYMGHDRSPSPPAHRMPHSPITTMAPPPRRLVIDQWGNRFMEAPMAVERHVSVAPIARASDLEHRYEPVMPRSASVVRHPKLMKVGDDGQYVRRDPSPISYQGVPRRVMVEPTGDLSDEASYISRGGGPPVTGYSNARPVARYEEVPDQDARIIRMRSVRPVERGHDEDLQGLQGLQSDERNIRMQSVRPQEYQYEAPRENFVQVQSMRPEQPRIIDLGERQESGRHFSRPVSMHPNNGGFRDVDYAVEERPRYQYASQVQPRGYIEEIPNNDGLYDTSGSGGRRLTQRM